MNGFYLRLRRNQLGLSLTKIADIPPSHICRYESGERLPSMSRAEAMADVLGIPMKWLVSVPTLTGRLNLARYFVELSDPHGAGVNLYISDDAKMLFPPPDLCEKIAEWVKIKREYDSGIIAWDEYCTVLFNLIDEQKYQTKKANLAFDVLKRGRIIVNLTEQFDPEMPARLRVNKWSHTRLWGTGIEQLSLPEIERLAVALRVPVEYLTDQFFFETNDDLLAFLMHIELSNRDKKPIIIPRGDIPDVSIEIIDSYVRSLLMLIKTWQMQYAKNEINYIQYVNRSQSLIRKY